MCTYTNRRCICKPRVCLEASVARSQGTTTMLGGLPGATWPTWMISWFLNEYPQMILVTFGIYTNLVTKKYWVIWLPNDYLGL